MNASASYQDDHNCTAGSSASHPANINADQLDENIPGKGKGKENFGVELTNKAGGYYVGSPPKRLAGDMLAEGFETPGNHKKGKVSVSEDEDDDGDWEQWEPPAPTKTKSS